MSTMSGKTKIWDEKHPDFGDILYKRAVGELPEMESSKKIAKIIKGIYKDGDKVLDAGCGAGHYLRSLRREIGPELNYTGSDLNGYYIKQANVAFSEDKKSDFFESDIYNLIFSDNEFDIVMCNNVVLGLPSLEKPLNELIRVSKRKVVIRLLCGKASYRIKQINPDFEEYGENGEPKNFIYANIYSEKYIQKILTNNPKVKDFTLKPDSDYDIQNIIDARESYPTNAYDVTDVVDGKQVKGYIILPWSIIEIDVWPYITNKT